LIGGLSGEAQGYDVLCRIPIENHQQPGKRKPDQYRKRRRKGKKSHSSPRTIEGRGDGKKPVDTPFRKERVFSFRKDEEGARVCHV